MNGARPKAGKNCTHVKTFVDTNILVYAYDRGAGPKHERARAAVEKLWHDGNGVVSVQVLQEFYVNVRRKARKPISPEQSRQLISDYLAWNPVINDGAILLAAMEIEKRFMLSFWDAMIVAAALKTGADILLSEDFNSGQVFDQVTVKNPFI